MKLLIKNGLIVAAILALTAPMATYAAKGGNAGGGGGSGGSAKMSTPLLDNNDMTKVPPAVNTQGTIDVGVTGGSPTGAPAGFSLQWCSNNPATPEAARCDPNNVVWPTSDKVCKASFSGNANGMSYSLAAGARVVVTLGLEAFLDDFGNPIAGATISTNCPDLLVCGTTYAIHAFAHANSTYQKSNWTPDLLVATENCGDGGTCRRHYPGTSACVNTLGFWRTHGPVPSGNNLDEWFVRTGDTMTVGSQTYNDLELLNILNSEPAGNKLLQMARQLIAAKLNVKAGASDLTIAAAIDAADALIAQYDDPATVPAGARLPAATCPKGQAGATCGNDATTLTALLDAYNNGAQVDGENNPIGPKHCDSFCTNDF